MIGSRAFSDTLYVANPGETAAREIKGDLFRKGRNTDPGVDEDGTLIVDWVMLVPPTEAINPYAEVTDPASGALFWVHGIPDPQKSLLRGEIDHYECRLKTVFRPICTVDIWRDSDTGDRNDLGDPVDTNPEPPPERQAVPASIVERSQILPTDTDLRTLTAWVGWVAIGTDVRVGDRVRVASPSPTGTPTVDSLFRVEALTLPVHTGLREIRMDLSRTSS
jgi:hypothetical protein